MSRSLAARDDAGVSANGRLNHIPKAHGDALTEVREIDHWACFPRETCRSAFVDKCLRLGLSMGSLSEPAGDTFGVRMFHADIPTLPTMDEMVRLLSGFAAECGGEYDGWETQILD